MRKLSMLLGLIGAVLIGLGIVVLSERLGWNQKVPTIDDDSTGSAFDATQVQSFIGTSSTPVWLPPDFNGTSVTPSASTTIPYTGFSGIDLYIMLIPSSTTSTVEFAALGSPDGTRYYDLGTTTDKLRVSTQASATTTYASNPYTIHRWQISSDATDYQWRYFPLEFEGPTDIKLMFRYGEGAGELRGGRVWIRGVMRELNN